MRLVTMVIGVLALLTQGACSDCQKDSECEAIAAEIRVKAQLRGIPIAGACNSTDPKATELADDCRRLRECNANVC